MRLALWASLFNDLLDIQRLASQHPALNPKKIAFCSFVEQIIVGIRAQVQDKEQMLEVLIAPTIAENPMGGCVKAEGQAGWTQVWVWLPLLG